MCAWYCCCCYTCIIVMIMIPNHARSISTTHSCLHYCSVKCMKSDHRERHPVEKLAIESYIHEKLQWQHSKPAQEVIIWPVDCSRSIAIACMGSTAECHIPFIPRWSNAWTEDSYDVYNVQWECKTDVHRLYLHAGLVRSRCPVKVMIIQMTPTYT